MSAVDIDGDGKSELLLHGCFIQEQGGPDVLNYWLFAFDENLQLKAGWPRDMGIQARMLAPSHPVFGDLDDDGSLEYITAYNDFSTGFIHVWDIDGTPFLGDSGQGFFAASFSPALFPPPVIFDADGDGSADILTGCAGNYVDSILDRITGYTQGAEFINGYPLGIGGDAFESETHVPLVGDIDQDGFVDLVYPSEQNILVFANFPGVPYRPDKAFCPIWRYNRRLNATYELSNDPICGDANNDWSVNVNDAVYIIEYVFKGGPAPKPTTEIGDANEDGNINIGDAVYLINYVFKGGPAPCADTK